MRLVLDTNVVASALLWGGIPRRLLQAAHERRVALFTSAPLLAELADVLGRRKFARKITASGFTAEQLVERYALLAAPVHPEPIPATYVIRTMMPSWPPRWRPVPMSSPPATRTCGCSIPGGGYRSSMPVRRCATHLGPMNK